MINKLELKIFNYSETTYGIKEFGAKSLNNRVDVTYFAKVRSKNAMLQRLLKLPHMDTSSINWIRERISQGEGGTERIITDDSIYVETDQPSLVIGKFTIDNKWIPFIPPLNPHRPWMKGKAKNDFPSWIQEQYKKIEGLLAMDERKLLDLIAQYKECSQIEFIASILRTELENYRRDLRFIRWREDKK